MPPWIAALAVGLCACGSVGSTAPDAAPDVPAGKTITLTVLTPHASVPLDGKNRITVEVTRGGGFTGPIMVAGQGPPAGVTVMPLVIPADATTGDVIVAGAAPLAIGDSVALTLQATADGVAPQTASLVAAPVTGRPGSLDSRFGPGGTGLASASFGADDDGLFTAIDVVNGKIIATGSGTGGLGEVSMATMRFTADGMVDPTWNGGATARTRFGTSSTGDDAEAVAIGRQADGRSVIIGANHDAGSTAPCPCTRDIAVARFSLTGTGGGIDFGNNGVSTVDLGGTEDIRDGVVLANNAIIAVGSKDGQFLVAQLSSGGSLDTGFAAPAGFDRVVHGTASEADAVLADAQGRIIVAGTFTTGGQTDLNMIRYLPSGAHDTGFGTAGEVIVPGAASEQTIALRALGDRLLLTSNAVDAGATSVRIRRFLADGTLDPSFGAFGVVEVPGISALDMVVLPDGRMVVLTAQSRLIRLTSRGAVDTLFGPDGTGQVSIFLGDFGVVGGLQLYSDDLLLVAGGNDGGSPGPGTFGVVARIWM